jgi:hypothetical protein
MIGAWFDTKMFVGIARVAAVSLKDPRSPPAIGAVAGMGTIVVAGGALEIVFAECGAPSGLVSRVRGGVGSKSAAPLGPSMDGFAGMVCGTLADAVGSSTGVIVLTGAGEFASSPMAGRVYTGSLPALEAFVEFKSD